MLSKSGRVDAVREDLRNVVFAFKYDHDRSLLSAKVRLKVLYSAKEGDFLPRAGGDVKQCVRGPFRIAMRRPEAYIGLADPECFGPRPKKISDRRCRHAWRDYRRHRGFPL